jgi:hypothetical protein
MSWPTPQDYNEAIQNPKVCFGDEELRQGTPELTPLGLPKPISGAFASVYQMNCGSRRWAVRCFLREVSDHQARYQAISAHLLAARLPSTVGFEFLNRGIRIRGEWYPILKMEWIDGEPLNVYIERQLNNPAALEALTKRWLETLAALRRHEIAHGDLQHGNVLVTQGQIKLIDYDGMYVPALAGLASHEEGHRNYQHPARNSMEFGPGLDAFSGWVVLLSLVAVAIDPRLWQRLNGGDECLLLRSDDFEKPVRSRAFQAIVAGRTPELRAMARQVQSFLSLPLPQVPAVDEINPALPELRRRPAALPEWLAHNRQSGVLEHDIALPALDEAEPHETEARSEWILEQIVDPSVASQLWDNVDFTGERVAAATTLLVVVSLTIAMLVGFVPGWLPLAVGSVLSTAAAFIALVGYRSHPYHARRLAAAQRERAAKARFLAVDAQARQLREDLQQATTEIRLRRHEYYALQGRMRGALAEIDYRHATERAACEKQLRNLEERELDGLDDVDWQLQQLVGALSQRINLSHSDEQAELAQTLAQMRQNSITDYLRQRPIADANLQGIGVKLKERLHASGIVTAADVEPQRVRAVEGIGDAKARELEDWATLHRWQAEALAPSALPALAKGAIVMRFDSLRDSIAASREAAELKSAARREKITDKYAAMEEAVDQRSQRIDDEHDREYAATCQQFERDRQRLLAEFHRLWPAASAELENFRAQRRKLETSLFSTRGDLLRIQRQLAQLAALTFARYLKRMAGWG